MTSQSALALAVSGFLDRERSRNGRFSVGVSGKWVSSYGRPKGESGRGRAPAGPPFSRPAARHTRIAISSW